MKADQIIRALSALAQEHRLAAYRLLVQAGESGIPAGALAEQLLLRENPTLDDRAANVDVTKAEAYHGNLNGAGVTLSNFSRCLAVYSPGLAFKVLKSDPGTSGEEDAVDALYGATPECGLTARPADIAPTAQRGPIAEGLYYWLHP